MVHRIRDSSAVASLPAQCAACMHMIATSAILLGGACTALPVPQGYHRSRWPIIASDCQTQRPFFPACCIFLATEPCVS